MRINAYTSNPNELGAEITNGINRTIPTWSQPDKTVLKFRHTSQWEDKGFVEMILRQGYVEFSIGVTDPRVNGGYILGRFVEVLMVHFATRFTKLEVWP
jgi:hypothetical protein